MLDEYGDVLTIADLQEILSIGRKKWRISKQAVIRYLDQEKK